MTELGLQVTVTLAVVSPASVNVACAREAMPVAIKTNFTPRS
jgi:hypothetical protein